MSITQLPNSFSPQNLHQLPGNIFSSILQYLTTSDVVNLILSRQALNIKIEEETRWKERSICILRFSYLSPMFPDFFKKEKIATHESALFRADYYKNEVNQFLKIHSSKLDKSELLSLLEKAAFEGDLEVVQKSLFLIPKDQLDHSAALKACAKSNFSKILDWFISSSFFQRKNPEFLIEGLLASLTCKSDENFFRLYKILQEENFPEGLTDVELMNNRLDFSELIRNSISYKQFKAFSLLLPLDRKFETQASALFELAKCTDPRFSNDFFDVHEPTQINESLLASAAEISIMYGNKSVYDKTASLLTKEDLGKVIQKSYPVAAMNGFLEMVTQLFTQVISSGNSLTILNQALKNGCIKKQDAVVNFLISKDNIKYLDKQSLTTALKTCVKKDNLPLFENVFTSKEEGFFETSILSKFLLIAVENECIEMVNLIVSKDPDVKLENYSFLSFNRNIYSILIENKKIDQKALLDVASQIISEGELDLISQFVKNFSNFIDMKFADRLLNIVLEKGDHKILKALLLNETISATFENQKWLSFFQRAIEDEKGEFVKQLLNFVNKDLEKEDLNKIIHALFKAGSDAITSDLRLYLDFFKIDKKQALLFVKENLNSVSDQVFRALLENQLIAEDQELLSEILEVLALEGSVEKVKAFFFTDICLSLKDSSILRAHANLMLAFKNGKNEAINGIDAIIISKRKDVLFVNYHIQQELCRGYF